MGWGQEATDGPHPTSGTGEQLLKPWFGFYARSDPQGGVPTLPHPWSHWVSCGLSMATVTAALFQVSIMYETVPCRALGMVVR